MRWLYRESRLAPWLRALPEGVAVHDFGCGEASFRHLIGKRAYLGLDQQSDAADVALRIPGDLDDWRPPGAAQHRLALVVGLLEYLDDVEPLVSWLARNYSAALLTYVCAPGPRLDCWRNALTEQELLALLHQHYSSVEARPDIYNEGAQRAFLCGSSPENTRHPVWVTIASTGRINYGNDLIEAAIDLALPGLRRRCSVRPLWTLDATCALPEARGVFVPGSTTLCLPQLVDWTARQPDRTIVLGGSAAGASEPQLAFWRRRATVFARDPITAQLLEAPLVGCPTLFCPEVEAPPGLAGRVLFSLSRVPLPSAFWSLPQLRGWTLVLHEHADAAAVPRTAVFRETIRLWDMKPQAALGMYQHARAVVAGRLHAFLPAFARCPTWYYGNTHDVRNSILSSLGAVVHAPEALLTLDARDIRASSPDLHAIQEMRAAFESALKVVAGSL